MTLRIFCLLLALSCAAAPAVAQTQTDVDAAVDQASQLAQKDLPAGIAQMDRAVQLATKVHGAESLETAKIIDFLANLYVWDKKQDKAEPLYKQCLAIREAKAGPNSPLTVDVLEHLTEMYWGLGRHADAEPLYGRIVKIREAMTPRDDLLLATSINRWANAFYQQNRYAEAEPLYERALKLDESKLGPDHLEVAVIVGNLAELKNNTGRHQQAEALYRRLVGIYEAKLGPDHLDLARPLFQIAQIYKATGRYSEAEPFYLRSLKIREAKLDPDDAAIGATLLGFGHYNSTLGRYSEAEPQLLRSLQIFEKSLGPKEVRTADVLSKLGNLYMSLGQYDKAESQLRRSLSIYEEKLGAEHLSVARGLNEVGLVLRLRLQYAAAEPLFLRSLKILDTEKHVASADLSLVLNNLAVLYRHTKRSAEAEALYTRAIAIDEKRLGPNHPSVASSLHNLGLVAKDAGKFAEAARRYTRALSIYENSFGPDHPFIAGTLMNLATVEIATGEFEQAADHTERQRRQVRRHIARTLPILSDREQMTFLDSTDRWRFHNSLSFALLPSVEQSVIDRTAGWLANGKAVVQESLADRLKMARDTRDPKTAKAAEQLANIRGELASLATTGGDDAARRAKIADLTAREQSLAKEIAAARGDPWISIYEIRNALPAGSVLIDIARIDFRQFEQQKSRADGLPVPGKGLGAHYVAWIIPPKGAAEIRVVNLGRAEIIDAAVADFRVAIADAQTGGKLKELGEAAAEKQMKQLLAEVSQLILDPLVPHLKDAKELVLSPDGALWTAPWDALPVEGDKYAVERWKIRMAVSGREVVLEQRWVAAVNVGPARVLANPDYDLSERGATEAYFATLYPNGKPPSATANPTPTVNATAPAAAGTTIGRALSLPATAVEAELIAPKLKDLTLEEPKLYLAGKAQEGILKLIRNPRYLVLSTHGYFLADQVSASDGKDPTAGEERTRSTPMGAGGQLPENPLLRCGLLFAGCNERERYTDPRLGDGVMTGLEIVGCDLRGTELVVLSACETGLGRVSNGEGVAGLRQAFQLAGARSVVSTLWQIPDRQSAVLMNDFFSNLAAGQTRSEALRNAQLTMIQNRREKHGAAHPLFWAAWTLTGD